MKAFVITSPQVGSVIEVPEPQIGEHDLLVEIERVGMDTNTSATIVTKLEFAMDIPARLRRGLLFLSSQPTNYLTT